MLALIPLRLVTGNAARPQNGLRKYRQTQLVYRALWKSVKRKKGLKVGHPPIPCHRVIREVGDLGGYRWASNVELLLAIEKDAGA
jgi:hypothetical protein